MKKWYAFETRSWDIIGALEEPLRRSSVLSRLRGGPTQTRERGNEMVESIFPNLDPERFDEIVADLVREVGDLVFSDSVMSIWDLNGDKYILPPVETEDPPAFDNTSLRADHLQSVVDYMDAQDVPEDFGPSTLQDRIDLAVLEAGFATEPLRHCLQELFECMYLRMLEDGMRGFSEREWRAVLEAKELLGHT